MVLLDTIEAYKNEYFKRHAAKTPLCSERPGMQGKTGILGFEAIRMFNLTIFRRLFPDKAFLKICR